MVKIPSLLSMGNGSLMKSMSVRRSKCGRCKIDILPKSDIGLLKTKQAGFTNEKRLCVNCVEEVISNTQTELDKIKDSF